MPALPDPTLTEFWYTALRSKSGVRVRATDRQLLKQKLYKARADLGDDSLKTLSITDDPENADCVWIVHSREASVGP